MPRLRCAIRIVVFAAAAVLSPGEFSARASRSDARLEELREKVRLDRYDLAARIDLAEFLEGTEDIELRREASEALREALQLEADDPELWIRFGRLQERRGFHEEAHDAYQNAIRSSPHRWDLWDAIAQHEFTRFQMQMHWKHFEDAVWANDRTLAANPTYVPAIRRGLRLAMIQDEQARVDSLCTVWEHLAPGDAWPHLVRGMLQAEAGAWDVAETAFRTGIDLLPEEPRRAFFRLDRVDPDQEEKRRESPDTLAFFEDYWRWRDPTPADLVNPRLIEHYRRMIQAELLFSLDRLDVRGWEHAPGEMIVRYGLPQWWSFLGGVARVQEYRVSPTMSAPTIEMIFGDDQAPLPLLFVDYNLNGRYYYPIEGFPLREELALSAVPSTYTAPFAAPEREQEIEIWRFVDPEGRGRIEIGVALSPEVWPREVLERPYRVSSRLTVYDPTWMPGDARMASWAPFSLDPLGRLVGRFELDGDSDSLILGVETADRQKSARAAGYTALSPAWEEPGAGDLAMSDLAFLSAVDFNDPHGAYGWGYGSGVPNPGHIYRSRDPVGIAFEAYDLAPGVEGLCQARIRVSIARETRSGWLRIALGGKGATGEAELMFDAQDRGTRLAQLLALELPPLDPGRYRLRVRVEDVGSERSGERTGVFQVVEGSGSP